MLSATFTLRYIIPVSFCIYYSIIFIFCFLLESSLEDPSLGDISESSFHVTFEKIEDATKRSKVKLVDSRGYGFNIKYSGKKSIEWQCTKRPKISLNLNQI